MCIDPNTDERFCGASADCQGANAGVMCAAGEICDGSGSCALSCQVGLIDCNGTCIDPSSNPTYCGATANCQGGVNCASDQACSAGVCVDIVGGCQPANVGLYAADNAGNHNDVASTLIATGQLNGVTIGGPVTTAFTPTLVELQSYDAVFVWGSASWDGNAFGDVLADYMDAGGGVVIGVFAQRPGAAVGVAGRMLSSNYVAYVPANHGFSSLSLSTVFVPGHPLMSGCLDLLWKQRRVSRRRPQLGRDSHRQLEQRTPPRCRLPADRRPDRAPRLLPRQLVLERGHGRPTAHGERAQLDPLRSVGRRDHRRRPVTRRADRPGRYDTARRGTRAGSGPHFGSCTGADDQGVHSVSTSKSSDAITPVASTMSMPPMRADSAPTVSSFRAR